MKNLFLKYITNNYENGIYVFVKQNIIFLLIRF